MANSMDSILVRYGATGIEEEFDASKHPEVKTVTVPEFLKLNPEDLTEDERKIQEAIRIVYDLNEKDPPLYKNFHHESAKKPLAINCCGKYALHASAVFWPSRNEVGFVDKEANLVGTLAHELKHAEQHAQPEIQAIFDGNDNLAKRVPFYLDEAEAFYTEAVVCVATGRMDHVSEFTPLKHYQYLLEKYTDENGHVDMSMVKEKALERLFGMLSDEGYGVYPIQAEMEYPMLNTDVGLTKIPEHYGLSENFMEVIRQMPREARFGCGKIVQCIKNHEENKLSESDIDKYTLRAFFNRLYMSKTDEEDAALIRTVINLKKKDGKPFFDTKMKIGAILPMETFGPKEFMDGIKLFQDEKGNLPFTAQDFFNKHGKNELLEKLYVYDEKTTHNALEMLPALYKLKGNDGKPLITPEQWMEELVGSGSLSSHIDNSQDFQRMFDALKDENGNLPFSREMFDIHDTKYKFRDGGNLLLETLKDYSDEEIKKSLARIPILMALRDKDGKPIISQENIEHFPKYSKLASAVKTYAEPKKTMTKALEENGNVGKGPAARKKSAEAKKKQPLQKATGVEL
ncbi:MAG: hypothetical protein II942_03750 [Alphaproteobacteria bacterium]|nr:hypothetical protein [Alphaproteobacteria bacterium]